MSQLIFKFITQTLIISFLGLDNVPVIAKILPACNFDDATSVVFDFLACNKKKKFKNFSLRVIVCTGFFAGSALRLAEVFLGA